MSMTGAVTHGYWDSNEGAGPVTPPLISFDETAAVSRDAMVSLLTLITQTAGGEAPEYAVMPTDNWAALGWDLIPLWIRLRWGQRRRKPNGYVAAEMRRYRLRHARFGGHAASLCR